MLDEETMDALLGVSDEEIIDGESPDEPTWDADLDEGGAELTGGPLADSYTRRVDDIWRHLRYREAAFGDKWPFAMDRTTRALTLKSALTDTQQVYVFFLLCSSLRYEPKPIANSLTTAFERVAYQAFRVAFPEWEVHIFGTSAPSGTRYSVGQLWERLTLLSEDLRCRVLIEKESISEQNTGDNGLDLVAWLPLPDKSKGLPMAFAQCACGASDWRMKQSEVSEERWGQILGLASPISNWTIIPFCYHNPQGVWETPHHVNKGVLIDRLRLFELLKSKIDQVEEVVKPLEFMAS